MGHVHPTARYQKSNTLRPNLNPNEIYDDVAGANPAAPVQPFAGPNHGTLYVFSGQIEYKLGGLTLSYIPAYVK